MIAASLTAAAVSIGGLAWGLGADPPTIAGLTLLALGACGFVHVYRVAGR
jgi:hypothetical protein